MVNATITPDKQELSVRMTVLGHSGYAPSGSDIVCAWVSSLVQTFIATADIMHQNGDMRSLEYQLEPGIADVYCRCDTEEEWRVLCTALAFVQTGLLLLERDYPRYIQVNGAERHIT